MGISDHPLRRRDLSRLGAAAATAATAAAVTGVSASRSAAAEPGPDGRHRLRREPGAVDALDLRLDDLGGGARRRGGARVTPVIATTGFEALGVTWSGGAGRVRARWRRQDGAWSPWRALRPMHHGPDPGSGETTSPAAATELRWVGRCDAVQLELDGGQQAPVLALLRPRLRAADAHAEETAIPSVAARGRRGAVRRPKMHGRKAWGADPDLRDGRPTYNRRIRQVHVHHTVNKNNYRRREVPAMIRAMYRYHTVNLGWSDIGYNFLVDRFGRLWVGRAGGPGRPVRGAHTLGFNHASVGVAVIGNFQRKRPNKRILRSVTRIASWKLDRYNGKPRRRIWITSGGSDRYPEGRRVRLPTIDGHRHTNATACPGDRLFRMLPNIRRRTARRIRKFRHARGG